MGGRGHPTDQPIRRAAPPPKQHNSTPWTTAEDDYLRKHYKNVSVETLVACMPGRTRNAVIARAFRLGLAVSTDNPNKPRKHRKSGGGDTPQIRRLNSAYPTPPPILSKEEIANRYEGTFDPVQGVAPKSLFDRGPHECQWPVEVNGSTLYCSAPTSGTYCALHAGLSRGRFSRVTPR